MKNLILSLVLFTSLISCGQHGHEHGNNGHEHHSGSDISESKTEEKNSFPTVGFIKTHEETIPFSIEKVFPLFEPQGRKLLYNKWNPTVLRKGNKDSLKGHVEFSKYDDLDVMLTVTKHNPNEGHIQYLVVWDDFEIQRIDIFCEEGENKNTTKVKWIEYNAGLYKKGVSLVSMFVNEGYLIKVVERYINNIQSELENE